MTLDQLPGAISDAQKSLDALKNSLRIVKELEGITVQVFIEAVSTWLELDKEQVIKLFQTRVDNAQAEVDKLTKLQALLNQTLLDAINGK